MSKATKRNPSVSASFDKFVKLAVDVAGATQVDRADYYREAVKVSGRIVRIRIAELEVDLEKVKATNDGLEARVDKLQAEVSDLADQLIHRSMDD